MKKITVLENAWSAKRLPPEEKSILPPVMHGKNGNVGLTNKLFVIMSHVTCLYKTGDVFHKSAEWCDASQNASVQFRWSNGENIWFSGPNVYLFLWARIPSETVGYNPHWIGLDEMIDNRKVLYFSQGSCPKSKWVKKINHFSSIILRIWKYIDILVLFC